MSGIDDEVLLIKPDVLESIQKLKNEVLHNDKASLNCEEILNALVVSATESDTAKKAAQYLTELNGCRAHCTAILSDSDEHMVRSLGIDVTCDPEYATNNLYFA